MSAPLPTAKTCTKCGEVKALEEFARHRRTLDGRGSYCRPCQAAYRRAWAAKHPKPERAPAWDHPASTDQECLAEGLRASMAVRKLEQSRSKVCTRCLRCLPLSEFHRQGSRSGGYQPRCKSCRSATRVKRVYTPRGSRRRLPDEPFCLGCGVTVKRAREDKRPPVRCPVCALERRREQTRAWNRAHPEVTSRARDNRRAAKRNAYVEDVSRAVVWDRDAGICHICKLPADPANWHLEHIVPLARGGEHSYANTAVSHPECNLRKGTKDLSEIE